MERSYLTRAKYNAYLEEIEYMEGEGARLLAKLLGSSPGSGMGRPNDLPIHQLAGEFRGYLQDIKGIVNSALIIDDLRHESADSSEAALGCTVTVRYESENEREEYTILGKHEVDLSEGKISCWSPVGASLIGKHIGDEVVVKLPPSREVRLVIEDIRRLPLDFAYSSANWKERLKKAMV